MSEKAARYEIVFGPHEGSKHPWLTIIDRWVNATPPLNIVHTSASWQVTATHLAFAMEKIQSLRTEIGRLRHALERIAKKLDNAVSQYINAVCNIATEAAKTPDNPQENTDGQEAPARQAEL